MDYMDYEPIDRRTSRFHVSYSPGMPTIINEITPDGERFYFCNNSAQVDFLRGISDRERLTDEHLDAACVALVQRQAGNERTRERQ